MVAGADRRLAQACLSRRNELSGVTRDDLPPPWRPEEGLLAHLRREGGLLFGSKNSQIGTLVERQTRYVNTGRTISTICCVDRLIPQSGAVTHGGLAVSRFASTTAVC